MSRRHPIVRRIASLGVATVALSLPLVVGCAGGPSQEELSLLEEKRMAAEAAEAKVSELRAVKARLERQVAEKQAEKQDLQAKLDAVRAAVATWPQD